MLVVGTVLRRTGDVNARRARHAGRDPARLSARDRGQSRQVRHFLLATDAYPGLQSLPSWVLRGEDGVQSVLHMIVRMESLLHLSRGPRKRLQI
jgi:hypothetical protein